ncbi:MAG: cysteine dioxygenase family protein [Bacteroidetes bacterium]|nr:cysteine dioxygenase family protein [Bacteroidota bacterium]
MSQLMINNLDQLIDALNQCSLEIYQYDEVFRAANIDLNEVENFIKWDPEHYTRNIIEGNEDYELMVICWEPGHKSGIHNHGTQEGWMDIIQGVIHEEMFDRASDDQEPHATTESDLEVKQVSYINDQIGMHRLSNTSDERAISLHLYVKPLDHFDIYNETTGEFSEFEIDK